MKRIYIYIGILAAIVLLSIPQDLSAKKKKRSKAAKTELQDSTKKKTEYEKFLAKKGLKTYDGLMKIYSVGEEIWLEIPDSLIGRKFIRSSILDKSSSIEMRTGMDVSNNAVYQVAKTDSLILFRAPLSEFIIKRENEGIKEALETSKAQETLYALPIKYRNADSTTYLVKANSLFDASKKEVVNLYSHNYNNFTIIKNDYKKDLSRTIEVENFDNTIGLRIEATYELTLYLLGFESLEKPTLTTEVLASLTLMPEKKIVAREVDSRVGVRKVKAYEYSSSEGVKTKEIASRWDISNENNITIYVDTLLGETWMQAVKKGLETWNLAFKKIGYNDVIKVRPYPANDPMFRVDNPLLSLVSYAGGTSTDVTASILTNSTSGEIMSIRIQIPGDFVTGVRRASVYTISDVDPRYQNYFLPDDAVCEVLTARVMSLFGRCLGLERNLAGSAAYSPEQLRSVSFTQANGITASVTDDVLFNIFAKPGDKEKGLVTIIDKLGPYDYYAIEWLYGHEGENTKEELKKLVETHKDDPIYFYAPNIQGKVSDPRITKGALGNDPFANHEASISHLKFVAENAHKWLDDEDIPQTYTELFIDWIWLGVNSSVYQLTSYIGGMYANEVSEDGNITKFTPVPKDTQKRALKLIFDTFSDVRWLEANKTLLHLAGANKDVTDFTNKNLFTLSDVVSRLMHIAMATEEAGSTYSVQEYMDDLEKLVFKDIKYGKFIPSGDIIVGSYLAMLLRLSPVMTHYYKDFTEGGKSINVADFRVLVKGVPVAYLEDMNVYAWKYMQRANKLLKQGLSSAKNDHDKKKIEYLLNITEAAIGK